jgi:hypothetical protein
MRETLRARLDNVRRHQSVAVSEAVSPYLLLAVLAASCFVSNGEGGTRLLVDSSLCAVTAVWLAAMYTLNPARRRPQAQGPRHAAVFITGLLVLTAVLTYRSGWFGFFIIVSFGYSRVLLRWPPREPPATRLAGGGMSTRRPGSPGKASPRRAGRSRRCGPSRSSPGG